MTLLPPEITLIHLEQERTIELHYPPPTSRFWVEVAVKVRRFLAADVMALVTSHHPVIAADWEAARAAFDRLATSTPPVRLTIDETHYGTDLLGALCTQLPKMREPWPQASALLSLWGQIARYEFLRLPPAGHEDPDDPAVRCYEDLQVRAEDHPAWLTLAEVHDCWQKMQPYKGKNEAILGLKRRFEGISGLYHLVLEVVRRHP